MLDSLLGIQIYHVLKGCISGTVHKNKYLAGDSRSYKDLFLCKTFDTYVRLGL